MSRLSIKSFLWPLNIAIITSGFLSGCQNPEIAQRNEIARERIWKGEKSHIVRYPWQEQIDAAGLADNGQLSRIISMTAEEVQHRLPSYKADTTNEILFNRGTSRHLQNAVMNFHSDTAANFHFSQKIGRDDVEYIMVGGTLYVRYVNGPFRSKEALNQPVEQLKNIPYDSIRESFAPWLKNIRLSAAEIVTHNNRSAYSYNLSFIRPADEERPTPPDDGSSDLDWRSYSWPTDLKGKIIVDAETAVLLMAHLEVKADILDRPMQPTTLQYTFDHTVSDILQAPEVSAPAKSINEYTVIKQFRGGKYRPKTADENSADKEKANE